MASGTAALELTLLALEVPPGSLVVTAPNSFMATVEAITRTGAEPRFVDVRPDTHNLDVDALRRYLETECTSSSGIVTERRSGRRVSAVIPVHLFGLPSEMTAILEISEKFGLAVIEDACQAHGAAINSGSDRRLAGSMGRAGCFSFYPGKNLGALGEAGAITTNDVDLARRLRVLRDHGQSQRYVHVTDRGANERLDSIQAAILRIKLTALDRWNQKRSSVAAWYAANLDRARVAIPVCPMGFEHVYHLYVIQVADRDLVRDVLTAAGIETGLHYPVPLHLQPALGRLGLGHGMYPEAERCAFEGLSLPMHPHMTENQVQIVARAVNQAVQRT